MKKQPVTTSEERKMKFAEAGVLFALVLALTIFVGARMASHDNADEAVAVHQTSSEATTTDLISEAREESVADPVDQDIVVADETATAGAESLSVSPPRIVTYAIAEQTYFDGKFAAAADMFDEYTAEHPDNAWGFYMLGLSEWKAGDLDASAEAFVAALDRNPEHVKSQINYGRVLLEQGRPADARIQLEAALRSAPDNVDANRVYARICHAEGRLDEAVESYLNVLQVREDDAWSLNNLGLIRIEQERFAEAVAPLAKAAQLSPAVACIQNNLGVALERTGHYTAAAEAFEMALNADAGYAKADESLQRVSGLTEASELPAIDLAAVAAGFSARPVAAIVTEENAEPADEITEVTGDMEVAAAGDGGLAPTEGDGD